MNKKIFALSIIFALFSNIANAAILTMKSATDDVNLDGEYIINKKTPKSWASKDGAISAKKIKSIKKDALIAGCRTYESIQKFDIKGEKPVIIYFLGLKGPNGVEQGSYTKFSVKDHRIIGHGTYEYHK